MSYLDHCGVYVKDLEKSLTFYKDIFGWKEKKRFGSGEAKICVLDMGKGLLELVQRPGSPGTPPGGNWTHLALHVDGWDAKVKKLEAKGLELRKVTMGDGSHIAFFKDPDGHTVEIMEKGLGKPA
jgi:catechol 2,3-dioxygenase-like lactoylglutathione lyase family enzyme